MSSHFWKYLQPPFYTFHSQVVFRIHWLSPAYLCLFIKLRLLLAVLFVLPFWCFNFKFSFCVLQPFKVSTLFLFFGLHFLLYLPAYPLHLFSWLCFPFLALGMQIFFDSFTLLSLHADSMDFNFLASSREFLSYFLFLKKCFLKFSIPESRASSCVSLLQWSWNYLCGNHFSGVQTQFLVLDRTMSNVV